MKCVEDNFFESHVKHKLLELEFIECNPTVSYIVRYKKTIIIIEVTAIRRIICLVCRAKTLERASSWSSIGFKVGSIKEG